MSAMNRDRGSSCGTAAATTSGSRHFVWRVRAFRSVLSRSALPFAVALGSSYTALAQDLAENALPEDLAELSLEELLNTRVVTASSSGAEERAMTSANVYVVTRQQIETHGWRSLGEILATVPGLYVMDNHLQPSVSVRGVSGGLNAGTRIIKVMIDGRAVAFQPELSASIGPEFIPIEAIERVEIAKGPLSALYGANAFLATVNVITREAPDGVHAVADLHGTFNHAGSAGQGVQTMVTHEGKGQGLLLAVSLDQVDRSGLELQRTFEGQPESPLFDDESRDDVAEPVSAFGRLRVDVGRAGEVTLLGGLQRLDSSAEFGTGSLLTHRSRLQLDNTWVGLRHTKQFPHARYTASLGYAEGGPVRRDTRLYATALTASSYFPNYDYRSYDGEWSYSHEVVDDRLTLGAGLRAALSKQRVLYYVQTFHEPIGQRQPGDTLDLINEDDSRTVRVHDLSMGVNAAATPFGDLPDLQFTGNLRLDRIAYAETSFPLQLSWRGAAAYRWSPDLVTKVVAGRAFQAPSAVLLYARPGMGPANNIIGNRLTPQGDLEPQRIDSLEGVISWQPLSVLTLELAGYQQTIDNRVEFERYGNNFVAVNRATRKSVGGDLVARFGYSALGAQLSATLDHPYEEDAPESSEAYPDHWLSGQLDLDLPEVYLHLGTVGTLVGDRGASQANIYQNNNRPYTLPGYFRWDVAVASTGLQLIDGLTETKFTLSVQNVLNEKHSEPGYDGFDVPATGRVSYLGVKQLF